MKLITKLIALCFAFTLAAAPLAVHAQDKASAKTEKSDKSGKSDKSKTAKKVDINTATAAELAKLPGIDADAASRIVAGRPYSSKALLKSKNIITEAIYNQITDLIVAKQPKKDGNKPKGGDKEKSKDKAK